MDKYPLGGSIPFVAFDTTELLSEGICADSVAVPDSVFHDKFPKRFPVIVQVIPGTISSTSFLYVSIGRIPSCILGAIPKFSHAPFSLAS